ncbi:MAG: site-specific integrase [Gammaproteobacteria bacterium]|nr:site-specific integrase [Gammaproteobacteria bacterium]
MATIRTRVGPKGTRYMAVVRREGQSRTATFRTKSEAKKWAGITEAAITQGKHLPSPEAKRRTVRDLLERYKRSEIPKKRDQASPTRYANFWIERIGDLRLARLNRAKIVEIRDELAEIRSPATVNRHLALISHACTMAEREWEWMDSNPLRKVGRLQEASGRVRYLSDDERHKLLRKAKASPHPHLYAIVLLALTSGARKGEILGLHWKDVDLASQRAILHDTKNRERRTLTLVPPVIEELKKLKKVRRIDTDLIFTHPATGKPNPFYFEKAWREARAEAELKDFRFHDLRHSCASYLAMNGATTAEIAAVLGHKTLAMVKRYSHLSDEHVRGVVERTARKVLGGD